MEYTRLQIIIRCAECKQQVTFSGAVMQWSVERVVKCIPHKLDCTARSVKILVGPSE